MYLFFALFCFPFQLLVCIPLLFGVEGTAEGLFWWMGVGEEFQTAGTEKMYRKAVHSRWLPPLSLYVNFRKDFALKSMLYPLICCECRIIYKTQKHRQWIKISLLKKAIFVWKKLGRGFHLKEIRASWKFPIPNIPLSLDFKVYMNRSFHLILHKKVFLYPKSNHVTVTALFQIIATSGSANTNLYRYFRTFAQIYCIRYILFKLLPRPDNELIVSELKRNEKKINPTRGIWNHRTDKRRAKKNVTRWCLLQKIQTWNR